MKRRSIYIRIVTLLTALCMIGAVGLTTAHAAPEDGENIQWWDREGFGEWYDYYNDYRNEGDSDYKEPEHLEELPKAESGVEEATAVPMPQVEVSDATLFSGIVMWLCVALGVAVLVGVMVSKRTGRRGG